MQYARHPRPAPEAQQRPEPRSLQFSRFRNAQRRPEPVQQDRSGEYRPHWSRIYLLEEIEGPVSEMSFGDKLRSANGFGIETVCNSDGGDFRSSMGIAKFVLDERRPTRAIGLNHIWSGCSIIFFSHQTKLLHPGATVMLHPPEYPDRRPPDAALELDRLELLDYYCARLPHLSRGQIETWMNHETYFTAPEAVECGLADGLLDPRVWVVDAAETSLVGKSRPGRPRTNSWPVTWRMPATPVARGKRQPIAVPAIPEGMEVRNGLFISSGLLANMRRFYGMMSPVACASSIRDSVDERIAEMSAGPRRLMEQKILATFRRAAHA